MSADAATADVVIPALNEERTIARCVRAVRFAMDQAGIQGKILVVDDGSTDGTGKAASAAGATVVSRGQRGGPLRAWMTGVEESTAPWIVFTDADCRIDSAAFVELGLGSVDQAVGVVAGHSVPEAVPGRSGPVIWSARFSAVLLHEIKLLLSDHDFQPIGRLMAIRRHYWSVDQATAGPCDRTVAHAAKAAGGRIEYQPRAKVYYTPVNAWGDLNKDYFRTVHSRAASRYDFDVIPRSIEVRAALVSIAKAPLGAVSWGLCRVLFRSRVSTQHRESARADVALRWNSEAPRAQPQPDEVEKGDDS